MIPDTSLCATLAEIQTLNVKLAFLRTSFDPSNKENPLVKQITFTDMGVNYLKENELKFTLQGNELYDDDRDFGDKTLKATFLSEGEILAMSGLRPPLTTCTMAQIALYQCIAYVHIQY